MYRISQAATLSVSYLKCFIRFEFLWFFFIVISGRLSKFQMVFVYCLMSDRVVHSWWHQRGEIGLFSSFTSHHYYEQLECYLWSISFNRGKRFEIIFFLSRSPSFSLENDNFTGKKHRHNNFIFYFSFTAGYISVIDSRNVILVGLFIVLFSFSISCEICRHLLMNVYKDEETLLTRFS